MEARISELRTQLSDGREALDAFVREHGKTGDYELFAAAVQSLEQKLHEVEARVVTADDQSSKGAQMELPHDSTPPTSPEPLRPSAPPLPPSSFREPEDELALALADFQAFGAEAQRQITPANQPAARAERPDRGPDDAARGQDGSASVTEARSVTRTRSALSRKSVNRANIGAPGADVARGRGSARHRKQPTPSATRSARSSQPKKSRPSGGAHRVKVSQRQNAFVTLAAPDKAARDALFARFDYNGNNSLSLAEIDKAIVEIWPEFNHKPALMRAYKAADVNQDGWVGRKEFGRLLEYLVYFNNLWHRFEEIDSSGDRRLSLEEFAAGCVAVGEQMTDGEIDAEFARIDTNGGGYVLFDEFCAWCAQRHAEDTSAGSPPAAQTGSITGAGGGQPVARTHAAQEELPRSPGNLRRSAKKQRGAKQVVPHTTSRTVRWGTVEISPDPPPSRTASREGIGLVMADTDALVRSFELSMRQPVAAVSKEPVIKPEQSALAAHLRSQSAIAAAYSADMLNNVAKGYTHQPEHTAAAQRTPSTVPLTASAERFYALLAMRQHDQRWQRARSYRFEYATKVANERCVELEDLVTETMTMADLGTLRFNTRRKLTDTMKYFVFELRLRLKMSAFLGWIWVVSRKQRDQHVIESLQTQIAMTQLVDVVQAWKGRVAETRRMRVIGSKLERKLGAIGVSRVWWAWRDVVLSKDWWRVHVKKCTGIVSRSLLRSRLRHWQGVVVSLEEKRREYMIAKALMARQRLAIAMESWVQACVVSHRQVGMISRVRRAIMHLAFSRWAHSTQSSHKLWAQLETSILKTIATRVKKRFLANCFDAFCSWFEKKLRQKLILQRMQAKHMHKASEACATIFHEWLEMVRQIRMESMKRLRLMGKIANQSSKKKLLTRCMAMWRLHASTTATAAEMAQEAGEAAEAAATLHSQAMVRLREQLQTETSLQLQQVKQDHAAAAEAAAKSAQDMLEIEVKARAQTEREAAADVAAAQEARNLAERARIEVQERLESEISAATRATAESASTAKDLATIEQKHAELVVQHRMRAEQAEQAEAALKRRSPLPIEEVEQALLSHERLQVEQAARLKAESQLQDTTHEQLKAEAQKRAEAEAEARRANAAVEELRVELQRLAVEQTAKRNQAINERVEVLYARGQRRRHLQIFEALRNWCDECIASRQRLFAVRRKLVRGCIRRAYGAWRNVVSAGSDSAEGGEGGDAWFDRLPATPMAHMDLAQAGYMEPIYSDEKIVRIQAAARGYVLRRDRRKQAKMSAARVKTFLHGCGLSRHWPAALRHNLTVATLLNLRDDQMKALGWSAADRRKFTKGLRLERVSMQRWVDSLDHSESSENASHVATRHQHVATLAPPAPQETITSPVLDALSTEADQLRSQLQALHLQEQIEHTRLSGRRGPAAIPEGTPPSPASRPVKTSSSGIEPYHPAREFNLLLTAMAGGADYQKFFHGQRSVRVLAGSVSELLQEISRALSQQDVSMTGSAELLYEDRRAGGNLVVLTNIEDLPSRASVVLNPVTEGATEELTDDGVQDTEDLPNSLLAFVTESEEAHHQEEGEEEEEGEELPNSLLSFNREHSPEPRRRSPAAVTPARSMQSPAQTPGSAVGLTPTRRVAKIDALIGELMLA